MEDIKQSNNVLNGIMGLCVADALGVPVEFESREKLEKNPVVGMRSKGTYNQPVGTWSDDSSMVVCLAESLCKGLDYEDIMINFREWINNGAFTPHGVSFDYGTSTRKAISRFERGKAPLKCGGTNELDNGNGSLMRILPIVYYIQAAYGAEIADREEIMGIIHNISSLTHAHKRSLIACGIYCYIAANIIGGSSLYSSIRDGICSAVEYYKSRSEFAEELSFYHRIVDIEKFAKSSVKEIKSSGYVVDTLEASIWCLLNSESYKECVLTAVNLGEDTDTVAAVAGGLAGLYYGYKSIPEEWLSVIVKRDYLEELCHRLNRATIKTSI